MRRGPHARERAVDPIDIARGYETRDISVSAIVKWIIFLFIITGTTALVTLAFYGYLTRHFSEPQNEVALEHTRRIPDPVVQPNPIQDIHDFRAREDAAVSSYGWVDPASGRVHIPIDQALEVVAAHGIDSIEGPNGLQLGAPSSAAPARANTPTTPGMPPKPAEQGQTIGQKGIHPPAQQNRQMQNGVGR